MAARRTTNFTPTQAQETELVDYCLSRVESLKADNHDRIEADRKARLSLKNARDERKAQGGVWLHSNLVLPMSSMIAESFISRAEDELFGVSPFFKADPRGAQDVELSKECDAYFRYKFGPQQAAVEPVMKQAIQQSYLQRAVIFKVFKSEKMAEWMDSSTAVLFDKETGKPVKVAGKNADEAPVFVAEDTAEWDEVQEPAADGSEAVVVKSVLRSDPTIVWDEARYEFRKMDKPMLREAVVYRGAKAVLVDSDAFLLSSKAASVDDDDCFERYDKPLTWIKDRFIERPWLTWRSFRATFQNATAKAKTDTERNTESREDLSFDDKTKMIECIECWVRRDVLGWGRPQEFMVLIEPTQRKAIYYEFQANLCPDLQRPFETFAIAPEDGKWWGENLMEKLDQFQDYADKQFNRETMRNSQNANPIGGIHPDACEEEPDEIQLGDGGLFRLKQGKRLSEFIEYATIPDLDTKTQALIEFVIYMVQMWLSVSNLSQGDYAELPQNSTKYGIQATLREASKLGRRFIRRTQDCFVRVITKMVKLQIDQLDLNEAFEVTEGKASELRRLTEDKVKQLRKLDVNVSLVLTQTTTDADIQAAEMALKVQSEYFATPPELMPARRPLFAKILEALGYKDTDELLPVPQLVPPGTPGAVPAGQPAIGGATNQPAGAVA